MILRFSGLVETGDDCRCMDYDDLKNGAIIVGGVDVVGEVHGAEFNNHVTVGILDERFDGELSVETGWGYSEYTPMDSDVLKVGEHDLIEILTRYEGQIITLYIADEPFNILDSESNEYAQPKAEAE